MLGAIIPLHYACRVRVRQPVSTSVGVERELDLRGINSDVNEGNHPLDGRGGFY